MAARQLPRRILSFLIPNQPSASPRVLFRREPISQILPVANSIFPRDGLCKRGLQTIAEASKQSAEENSIKLNSNTASCASATISNPAASDVSMGGHKVTSKLKQSSTNDAGILPPNKSRSRPTFACSRSLFEPTRISDINTSQMPFSARSFASKTSESTKQSKSETRKDISAFEDPFDAPTDIIPEKPVTFTEGVSYSLIILAGLGVAAAAAYAVFSELIFQPKEYKIFNKALKRIQDDGQVRVRIGSPITGYGSESRNRAARQRVPNRTWVDEDKVEHIEVNFYIRGPHGAGKVFTEMFKDKEDGEWKFMYLIVEITSPSRQQLILESYIPA